MEGQKSKVDQFETTTARLRAIVQTLVEENQQEKEKYQELARQLQVLYSGGWPRVVGIREIITIGNDQSQVWESVTFGGPCGTSVGISYQEQQAPEASQY